MLQVARVLADITLIAGNLLGVLAAILDLADDHLLLADDLLQLLEQLLQTQLLFALGGEVVGPTQQVKDLLEVLGQGSALLHRLANVVKAAQLLSTEELNESIELGGNRVIAAALQNFLELGRTVAVLLAVAFLQTLLEDEQRLLKLAILLGQVLFRGRELFLVELTFFAHTGQRPIGLIGLDSQDEQHRRGQAERGLE